MLYKINKDAMVSFNSVTQEGDKIRVEYTYKNYASEPRLLETTIDLPFAAFERAANDAGRRGVQILDLTPEGLAKIKKQPAKPLPPGPSQAP